VTTELDLLTANLWGLPWPVSRERHARKRRFTEHLARSAYDLVGIQELWWPWRRALRLRSLEIPRTSRDSGLALAGRLPVREPVRVEHFQRGVGVDRLKRKGALRAGVETASGDVSVCVAHLQAGPRHASVRAHQLQQLLEQLDSERRPVVLMGDFNLHDDCEEDRRSAEQVRAAGFADAALALARPEPTYHAASNPYVRGPRTAHRFDRVYLRDGSGVRMRPLQADVVRLNPRPVSDHHPLRVRVRVSS
jgi:endonuclease/exonuclease/phosphatase family metal-dependent hydrolase